MFKLMITRLRVSIVASLTSVIRSNTRIERLWKIKPQTTLITSSDKERLYSTPLDLPGEFI